jgi:hypothetical protein
MSTLEDYIEAVGSFVQGELPLGETEIILAVKKSIKEHSKHKPQVVVEDVDGDGGFDYAVSGLASYLDEFSTIKTVEYPVDDDDEAANVLQDSEWKIYEKPSGKVLRFLSLTPAAAEDLRVTYTALHTCTVSACTVTDFDEEAVQMLAAAHFCTMLSTYYAQSQDSTIGADSVDHKSKSREYAASAKVFKLEYYDHMGIKPGKTPAASVTMDQDLPGSWAGDKLTHKSRYR